MIIDNLTKPEGTAPKGDNQNKPRKGFYNKNRRPQGKKDNTRSETNVAGGTDTTATTKFAAVSKESVIKSEDNRSERSIRIDEAIKNATDLSSRSQYSTQNRRNRHKPSNQQNKPAANAQSKLVPVSQEVQAVPAAKQNQHNRPKQTGQQNQSAPVKQDNRNGQNKKGGGNNNGRKRPQIHYNDEDIKMIRNNYVSRQDDDAGKPIVYNDMPNTDIASDANELGTGAVIGRNAVRELLKSDRSVDKLFVRRGDREGSIVVIVAEAVNKHIPVIEVESSKLDFLSGGANHQGVVAMAAEKEYTDIDGILAIAESRGEVPLIVIADEIADPYNLGALIRCAEGAGVHGIIIPKRRAAGLTPVVTKTSAGAIEHLAIAKVTNIGTAIDELKKKGLWIYAAEAGGTAYYDTKFDSPAAIVFGSEGNGIGKLIMSKCDFTVSIPMYGHVNSLNVSTAASVILCHAARMQRQK